MNDPQNMMSFFYLFHCIFCPKHNCNAICGDMGIVERGAFERLSATTEQAAKCTGRPPQRVTYQRRAAGFAALRPRIDRLASLVRQAANSVIGVREPEPLECASLKVEPETEPIIFGFKGTESGTGTRNPQIVRGSSTEFRRKID